jgi:hypothetical protein
MQTRPDWQYIRQTAEGGGVRRLRVPGGWLYETSRPSGGAFAVALCFVPLTGNAQEDSINDPTP